MGKDFTAEQLSRERLRLLKEHHPDKGGKPESFAVIEKGYKTLADETERKRYNVKIGIDRLYDGRLNDESKAKKMTLVCAFLLLIIVVPIFIIMPMYEKITKPVECINFNEGKQP